MPASFRKDGAGLVFLGRPLDPSYRYHALQKHHTGVSNAGRSNTMCDYSLHTYPNRLATDGEELVVHRFGAGSLGLASPADLAPVISAGRTAHDSWWSRGKAWFLGNNPKWEAEKRVPAVCIPPGARLFCATFQETCSANWESAKSRKCNLSRHGRSEYLS